MAESNETEKSKGISLRLMLAGVFALLIFLLWGFACAMYDVAEGYRWSGHGAGGGVVAFVSTAFIHLPHIPDVVRYIWVERVWYIFVVVGVLVAALLFSALVRRVQRQLEEPPKKKRPPSSRR